MTGYLLDADINDSKYADEKKTPQKTKNHPQDHIITFHKGEAIPKAPIITGKKHHAQQSQTHIKLVGEIKKGRTVILPARCQHTISNKKVAQYSKDTLPKNVAAKSGQSPGFPDR